MSRITSAGRSRLTSASDELALVGLEHREALLLEVVADEVADVLLVLDDEDLALAAAVAATLIDGLMRPVG